MRKIINSTYISGDERAGQTQTDLLLSCDALLMGRCTYDGFAPI